jgi:Mg-chelatase subunit ChlD
MKKTFTPITLLLAIVISGCSSTANSENLESKKTSNEEQVAMQEKNNETLEAESSEAITKSDDSLTSNELSCQSVYDQMLDRHGESYDDCGVNISKTDCSNDPNSEVSKKTNLVLIIDASGSMAAQIDGSSKMQIAKEAVKNYTNTLESDINLALVVYGHKGSNQPQDKNISCSGIEEVFELGQVDLSDINQAVDSLSPTGYTPIAASLEKSEEILSNYQGEEYNNVALIISDGEETCEGDPAKIASDLKGSDIKLVTNVIGFDVGGVAENQLKSIASNGGGQYLSVNSEEAFENAFKDFKNWEEMFNCQMNEEMNSLNDHLNIVNNAFKCEHRLDMEELEFMNEYDLLGVGGDEEDTRIKDQCGDFILGNYDERTEKIREQIEQIIEDNEDQLEKNREEFDQTLEAEFDDLADDYLDEYDQYLN